MNLPEDYIVEKFYQFAGKPSKNRYNNTYQGSCPMCREGNSWLKKKRFYFIPKNNNVFCHNCGYSKTPLQWISEICNISISDVLFESNQSFSLSSLEVQKPKFVTETLPKDSINLFDKIQLDYYKDNSIVKKGLEFLDTRKLVNAVNIPKALYLSLVDKVHKNRLIIPFYDENDKIVYYQTRTILDSDNLTKPRYLSKINSEKTIFNINNIYPDYDTIFIFEGPLNSCFIKNGVAIGGIQENSYQLYTSKQQDQIDNYKFHKKIWVLDSQWKDKAAYNKTKKLLELNESVFIWPKSLGSKYKDFNDIAIALNCNHISPDFIKKYTR